MDPAGNTIIINGSVAVLGSPPRDGALPTLSSRDYLQTADTPLPSLERTPGPRRWPAQDRAERFTLDQALALSLGRIR